MPRGKGKTSSGRQRAMSAEASPTVSVRQDPRAGRLEGPRDDHLWGWACDDRGDGAPARLVISSDVGHQLGVVADEPREDVREAGYGDGRSGFCIPLRSLTEATWLSCRWADTGLHLMGSPMALPRQLGPSMNDAAARRTGNVDALSDGRIVGWAWDLDHPGQRARIRVRSDAGHDFELVADQHRADVQVAGHGDGQVGFCLPLRRLDAASVVSLCWPDTRAHLLGSPLALGNTAEPIVTQVAVGVDGPGWMLRIETFQPGSRVISGFFADLQDLNRHALLVLERDDREISRARACRYHPGAPGDRMHGFKFLLDAPLPDGRCAVRDRESERLLATFEAPV